MKRINRLVLAGGLVAFLAACGGGPAGEDDLERARRLLESGRAAEAAELLAPVAETGDPGQVLLAARAAIEADRLGQAVEWLERCRSDYPEAREVTIAYARLITRLGRYDEALAALEPLVEPEPRILNLIGFASMVAGDLEGGREYLERSIREARSRGRDYAPPHYHLGLYHAQKGDWSAAIEEFRTAVTANPEHLEAHYQWIGAAERLGLVDEAERAGDGFARIFGTRMRSIGALGEPPEPDAAATEQTARSSRASGRPANSQPNILLVSLDTLRADRLGCYGASRPTSPVIDRLALEGVRFDQAEASSSWTLPSHYSIFTGLSPLGHGVMPDLAQVQGYVFAEQHMAVRGSGRETMLAEALGDLGYRTAAVTEDGWVSEKFGFDQGFASYRSQSEGSLPATARAALVELNQARGETPWFLFVHTFAPHQPYHAPVDLRTRWADPEHTGFAWPRARVPISDYMRFRFPLFPPAPSDVRTYHDLYDGQIRWADTLVEELLGWIAEEEIERDTVVAVISDHGEEIFERSTFDHGYTLFEEVTRVPLILRAPGRIPSGVVVRGPVPLTDLAATLLDLAGASDRLGQGRSLRELWERPGNPSSRVAFGETTDVDGRLVAAVWSGSLKYIRREIGDRPVESLFDLGRDPRERYDLSGSRSKDLARMRELYERHRESATAIQETLGTGEGTLDQETIDRLRALGYTQ
jgi:arylsulfatase A-like enzyme/Flp pilus assembly protein TadD